MDTGFYLFLGYAAFWILPCVYLALLVKKVVRFEKELEERRPS